MDFVGSALGKKKLATDKENNSLVVDIAKSFQRAPLATQPWLEFQQLRGPRFSEPMHPPIGAAEQVVVETVSSSTSNSVPC